MTGPRLPDGFAVQVDRRVRVLGEGAALLGGSPTRLLRLAPAAQTMLNGGRLEVHDAVSAQLARTLLDATVAHPRPAQRPVAPRRHCRYPSAGQRFWAGAAGRGAARDARRHRRRRLGDAGASSPTSTEMHCDVRMLRNTRSKGPAAARNAGLAACNTDFVAFLDSDVVPRRGWLEALLGHFCDPAVALVAPRIVALQPSDSVVARYEAVRSSLDLGLREAPVVPVRHGVLRAQRRDHLPPPRADRASAASTRRWSPARTSTCAGASTRPAPGCATSPSRLVAHDHRTELRKWFARKSFYGELGRAAGDPAPRQDRAAGDLGLDAGGLGAAWPSGRASATWRRRPSRRSPAAGSPSHCRACETEPMEVAVVAAHGLWSAALQLASAICRHYWPIALVAAVLSRRCRQVVLVAAVLDGVFDWVTRNGNADDDTKRVGVFAYILLKRLDDIAYGLGLWTGVVRERHAGALKPQIRT